ncbi:SDR family oxidoreductase [Pseudoalteromonas tunicata]|jgi:nucleoside-diphosphate-sugar epimerase|uniref:Uncharacterized protein n=1 Tax=Pseudoalteromonas tunicata D2 TaxID=87626 RepID=A4C8E4_9GAMM|nr:SDR family oxidoreductase [Pseudoalteromonas tunicata]ATC93364.1 hypothetical protein PTUN_a0591 [Pseudoalteromonas tunicata]AXT32412.1 SDR family oxidoreductase [Pseudoalteromonas tunicata]EAR28859.1 hypothetical protein PTD2_07444 [Pseudoalteromonas tunicata D2]
MLMKNTEKKCVILGHGWLGQDLKQQLIGKKYGVDATVRDPEKAEQLGLQYFSLSNEVLNHNIECKDAYWVCCIPPGFRREESNYLTVLAAALKLAQSQAMKGFLLCSSTGIYPSQAGLFHEQSSLNDLNLKQQGLLEAEQLVLSSGLGKVVRLAGLMGPKRHPGRFVAGKQLASSANESVNMVHQRDASNAIVHILENWSGAEPIYNLVMADHSCKADFYQQACKQLGTASPTFETDHQVERIIDGSAIEQLGFRYQFSRLADALEYCQ